MCVKESVKYQMSYVHSPQLSLSLRCFDIILSLCPSVCPLMSDPTVGSHGCRGWGGCPISTETMLLVSQEDDGAFYSSPAAAASGVCSQVALLSVVSPAPVSSSRCNKSKSFDNAEKMNVASPFVVRGGEMRAAAKYWPVQLIPRPFHSA